MTLGERLKSDYVAAYKQGDKIRLDVLRLLKTAMTNRLVELKQPGGNLDDNEIMELLLRQAKQRKDSIGQYLAARREDLAEKEKKELEILEDYLPKPLSEAETGKAVEAAIAEIGAKERRDMGKVISLVMAKYKGAVDGKIVSALAGKKLAGG